MSRYGARALAARVPLAAMTPPDPDRDALAWREIDGQLIFLDVAADRYFRLGPEQNRAFLDMIAKTGREHWHQPPDFPRPSSWSPANRTSQAIELGTFSLPEIAHSLWIQRRIERRIATSGLQSVLCETRGLLVRRERHSGDPSTPDRIVRSFEHARILRTAANRCLPRSIALAIRFASCGTRANVVIAVKLAPFSAHCWAQVGDVVLNDSVEEVQRYTPLLVL